MKNKLFNLLIIFWPILISSIFLWMFFRKTVFDFTPYWSDEIIYWISSKTFSAVGWSGGYFGVNEQQAPLGFSHWGLHGPLFPILYSILNYPFGWHLASGVITNHVLLTMALFFFIKQINSLTINKVFLFLFVGSFWPLSQFATSNMQESWHHALALFLAGLAVRMSLSESRKFDFFDYLGIFLLVYSSFMRPSWAIFSFPLCFVFFKNKKELLLSSILAVVLIPMSPLVFKFFAAPMPLGGAQFVKFMTGNEGLLGTINYFKHNLLLFLEGDQTERNQRIQIIILILFTGVLTVIKLIQQGRSFIKSAGAKAVAISCYILFSYVFATLAMYLVGSQADYRILSAPLLFSVCFLSGFNFRWFKYLILVFVFLNIMALPQYLLNYKEYRAPLYTFDSNKYKILENELRHHLKYEPVASPWCNTIFSGGLEPWVYPEFAVIPAGFGIQAVWSWAYMKAPLKSQFVILDKRSYLGEDLETRPHMEILSKNGSRVELKIENFGIIDVEELAELSLDNRHVLLRNLNSGCEK